MKNLGSYSIPPHVLRLAERREGWRTIPIQGEQVGVRYVTADWDSFTPNGKAVEAELARFNLSFPRGYSWRASSSRAGVHLVFAHFDPMLSAREGFTLRDRVGDDRVRLVFDAYRYSRTTDLRHVRGLLFDQKLTDGVPRYAGPWHHIHGVRCGPGGVWCGEVTYG
jgi:hypothetical protein